MPYRSAKQRAFMHIHHPGIAKRWDKEYGGAVATKKLSKKDKKEAARRIIEKKALKRKSGKKNMFSNAASGSY